MIGSVYPSSMPTTSRTFGAHNPPELLDLYCLPTLLPLYLLIDSDLLRSVILHFPPRNLVLRISSAIIRDVCFSYSQVFKQSHLLISYCFSLKPLPTPTVRTSAYMLDSETKIILKSLQTRSKVSSENLAQISSTYRQALANNRIHLIDKKLVYYEQTLTSTK